jgi:hypothetical protein
VYSRTDQGAAAIVRHGFHRQLRRTNVRMASGDCGCADTGLPESGIRQAVSDDAVLLPDSDPSLR